MKIYMFHSVGNTESNDLSSEMCIKAGYKAFIISSAQLNNINNTENKHISGKGIGCTIKMGEKLYFIKNKNYLVYSKSNFLI